MTDKRNLYQLGLKEHTALKRFVIFIEEIRQARIKRGESDILDTQVFIAEMLSTVKLYRLQQDKELRIDAGKENISKIQKLADEFQAALSKLNHSERNLLFKEASFYDAVEETQRLNIVSSSLLKSSTRGPKRDEALSSVTHKFVISCIDHGWLPIRVPSSANETKTSEHRQCLAMILEEAGMLNHVSKDRSNLLTGKANSSLRQLRTGFEYIAQQTEEQKKFGELYIFKAGFNGKSFTSRFKESCDEDYSDSTHLEDLPNFIPPDAR